MIRAVSKTEFCLIAAETGNPRLTGKQISLQFSQSRLNCRGLHIQGLCVTEGKADHRTDTESRERNEAINAGRKIHTNMETTA